MGIIEHDCRAEAEAAMAMAAAATCELERLEWLRVAVAWRDLSRTRQRDVRDVQRVVKHYAASILDFTDKMTRETLPSFGPAPEPPKSNVVAMKKRRWPAFLKFIHFS
jgi:hypothetical protein